MKRMHARKRGALIATTLAGIAGLTLLRPFVPDSVLDTTYVTVDQVGEGDTREVLIDTPYLHFATNNKTEDRDPEAHGWFAVWERLTTDGWQIVMYNGEDNTETTLTQIQGDQKDPHTDGRYIVWQGRGEGKWNIYLYDTENPETGAVKINSAAPAIHPRISEGTVVWQQWAGNNWEIFTKDVGGSETRLTSNGIQDIQPDIFHSLVVWTMVRQGPRTRVRVHDLRSGDEQDLIADADGQIRPSFSKQGALQWFDFAGEGYTKQEYNFLTDILNQHVIIEPKVLVEEPSAPFPVDEPLPPVEEPTPPAEEPPPPPVEEPTPPPAEEPPPPPVEEPPPPPVEEPPV